MEILTVAQATGLVTTVVGYLTANWAAVLVLVGFGVGLALFRRLVNHGLKGRI